MKTETRIVSALWLWLLANYLDRVAISFAGPSIMQSLALSPAQFGIILSSFGIGYLLSHIPGGLIADRWGYKVVLVVGPVFWAFFSGMTGLVSTLLALVIMRAISGVSVGLPVAAMMKCVGDNFAPKERARAMGIGLTALALAPAAASPVVGWLVATYDWRTMFFLMTTPALVAACAAYTLIPASGPQSAVNTVSEEVGPFRQVLVRPTFWILSIAYLAYNIAFWGYLGWMPSYLALAHNINLKALGLLAAIPYLFALAGLLLGGWLGTGPAHRHRPQLIACSLAFAGLSLFMAYSVEGVTKSLAGLSGAAFFLYGCQPSISATFLDLAPARFRATYVGCVSTIGQIGGLVAPGIVGLLVSATGSFAAGFGFMVVALGVAAVGLLVLASLMNRERQPPTAQP